MGETTEIGWCDATFNPWWGCSKVAAGCAHCYAEALSKRTGRAKWGPEGTRVLTSEANWRLPRKWNRAAASDGERRRVFCASMADVFEDWGGPIYDHRGAVACQLAVPLSMADVRADLFDLIDATPHLDWLLLTKRPENIPRMWPACRGAPDDVCDDDGQTYSLHRHNVWLLASVAEQADVERNVPLLLKCQGFAPVLGLSCEPLIEAIKLPAEMVGMLQWMIVGGESGPGRRPVDAEAIEDVARQCQFNGVPVFVKQDAGPRPGTQGRISDECWAMKQFPKETEHGQ